MRDPTHSFRVRPGTALARLLTAQDGRDFTDRLHRLAERLEALEDVRSAIVAAASSDQGDAARLRLLRAE